MGQFQDNADAVIAVNFSKPGLGNGNSNSNYYPTVDLTSGGAGCTSANYFLVRSNGKVSQDNGTNKIRAYRSATIDFVFDLWAFNPGNNPNFRPIDMIRPIGIAFQFAGTGSGVGKAAMSNVPYADIAFYPADSYGGRGAVMRVTDAYTASGQGSGRGASAQFDWNFFIFFQRIDTGAVGMIDPDLENDVPPAAG